MTRVRITITDAASTCDSSSCSKLWTARKRRYITLPPPRDGEREEDDPLEAAEALAQLAEHGELHSRARE